MSGKEERFSETSDQIEFLTPPSTPSDCFESASTTPEPEESLECSPEDQRSNLQCNVLSLVGETPQIETHSSTLDTPSSSSPKPSVAEEDKDVTPVFEVEESSNYTPQRIEESRPGRRINLTGRKLSYERETVQTKHDDGWGPTKSTAQNDYGWVSSVNMRYYKCGRKTRNNWAQLKEKDMSWSEDSFIREDLVLEDEGTYFSSGQKSFVIGQHTIPLKTDQTVGEYLKSFLLKTYLDIWVKSPYPIQLIIRQLKNYFMLELPHGKLFHYTMDVEEFRCEKDTSEWISCLVDEKVMRKFLQIATELYPDAFADTSPMFGGHMHIITTVNLQGPLTFDVEESDCEKQYLVTITPVMNKKQSCVITLDSPYELLKRRWVLPEEQKLVWSMVMEHMPFVPLEPVGRLHFSLQKPEAAISSKNFTNLWKGYKQEIDIGHWKPYMEKKFRIQCKIPLVDFLENRLKRNLSEGIANMTHEEIRKMSLLLQGRKIVVTHLAYPRKYTIDRLTILPARSQCIKHPPGVRQQTVAEYFLATYKFNLKYPHLSCILAKPPMKSTYIPLEVCVMAREDWIFAERNGRIKCRSLKTTDNGQSDVEQEFEVEDGLDIPDPLDSQGSVLQHPDLSYENAVIIPDGTTWNMLNKRVLSGPVIGDWLLLSFASLRDCSLRGLDNFANRLLHAADVIGMDLRMPLRIQTFDKSVAPENVFSNLSSRFPTVTFLIVILAKKDTKLEEIRCIAEREVGIMAQCIRVNNLRKKNPINILVNICQKLNTKMGGVDYSITPPKENLFKTPVLIVGADVSHFYRQKEQWYSVASLVGSMDCHPLKYAATASTQITGKEDKESPEVIVNLKLMAKQMLHAFYAANNFLLPEKIIIYRDGVSEGQFAQILNFELVQWRKACTEIIREVCLQGKKVSTYRPRITYIVVQKRHRTSPPSPGKEPPTNGIGRGLNIPLGKMPNKSPSNPVQFDFWLCSYSSVTGNCRPARYCVLWDDSNFTPGEIEMWSYYMCLIYGRCTRSMSVPVPVQYAHRIVYKARYHLLKNPEPANEEEWKQKISPEKLREAIKISEISDVLRNTLYFI